MLPNKRLLDPSTTACSRQLAQMITSLLSSISWPWKARSKSSLTILDSSRELQQMLMRFRLALVARTIMSLGIRHKRYQWRCQRLSSRIPLIPFHQHPNLERTSYMESLQTKEQLSATKINLSPPRMPTVCPPQCRLTISGSSRCSRTLIQVATTPTLDVLAMNRIRWWRISNSMRFTERAIQTTKLSKRKEE